jgi:hypothetical protein
MPLTLGGAFHSGLQLTGEKVVAEDELRGRRLTKLDVSHLVMELKEKNPFYVVRTSDDPGRFICNYTYYASLARSDASANQVSPIQCFALFFAAQVASLVGFSQTSLFW